MYSSGMFDSALMMLSAYVAGALIALGVAIFIGALMLRLAAFVLKFPVIRFENAAYATAVTTVTLFSIHFSISTFFLATATTMTSGSGRMGQSFLPSLFSLISPDFMTLSSTLGILFSAVVYQRILIFEDVDSYHEDETKVEPKRIALKFGDAVALAAVQVGVSMLCCLVLGGMFAFTVLFLTKSF